MAHAALTLVRVKKAVKLSENSFFPKNSCALREMHLSGILGDRYDELNRFILGIPEQTSRPESYLSPFILFLESFPSIFLL